MWTIQIAEGKTKLFFQPLSYLLNIETQLGFGKQKVNCFIDILSQFRDHYEDDYDVGDEQFIIMTD